MSAYLCDGELVCDACAVDVTDEEMVIGGESDSPKHCAYCHRPLFDDVYGLTQEGLAYVLRAVEDALRAGHASNPGNWRWSHGWYLGLDQNACLRDWAEYASDHFYQYGGARQRHDAKRFSRVLRWFLYLSDDSRVRHQVKPVERRLLSTWL